MEQRQQSDRCPKKTFEYSRTAIELRFQVCPFQKPCTYQLKRRTEIGQTHHFPILQITGTQIGQIAGKRRLCRNHQPNGAEHHAGHKQREVFFVETRYPAFYGEKKPVERDPFMHFSPLLRLVGQRFNMPPATYTGVQTGHACGPSPKDSGNHSRHCQARIR